QRLHRAKRAAAPQRDALRVAAVDFHRLAADELHLRLLRAVAQLEPPGEAQRVAGGVQRADVGLTQRSGPGETIWQRRGKVHAGASASVVGGARQVNRRVTHALASDKRNWLSSGPHSSVSKTCNREGS